MESKQIFSGKTVEDAIEAGLNELGITRDEAEIEIIEEGKKGGLFGIGAVSAQVKVSQKPKLTDGERVVAFLEGLFEILSIDAIPELKEEDERIVIDLATASSKGIIGRRGETIDAVQALAGAIANTGRRDYIRVVVDCGNYREDREETLRRVAEKMAAKAVRLGKKVRLEPMNPYERRIIHAALVDNPDVTTKSEGKEPARFVVITPKNMRPDRKDGFDRNRNGRGRYGDKKEGRKGGYGDRNSQHGEKFGERSKSYPKRELPKDGTPQSSGTSLNRGGGAGYKKGGFSGFFGTFLGNSRDSETETNENTENHEE